MGSIDRIRLVAWAMALEALERIGAAIGRQDLRDWADDRWARAVRRLAAD